jgi:hypothetical protein
MFPKLHHEIYEKGLRKTPKRETGETNKRP